MSTVTVAVPAGSASQRFDDSYRLAWTVSPTGRAVVCMVLDSRAEAILELRRPFSASHRRILAVQGLRPESPLAVDDCGTITTAVVNDEHWQLMDLRSDGTRSRWIARPPAAARLQPGPGGTWLAHESYSRGTRISQVTSTGMRNLCEVSHRVLATHRWDEKTLLLNVIEPSGHTGSVRVDIPTGDSQDFYSVSDRSDDRIIKVLPAADLVIVSTTATGEPRIGWGRFSEGRITFPAAGSSDRGLHLVGTTADGATAILAEDRGLRITLRIVDLRTGEWQAVEMPPMYLVGQVVTADDGLILPAAEPSHQATMIKIQTTPGNGPLVITPESVVYDDPAAADAPPCHVVDVPGGGGPIDSLVVGDLQSADQVVIALHGGPIAAWRSGYNPLFAELAAAGIAVVAPNIRGSVGYGRAHTYAIKDRWGTVDADDVRSVRQWLADRRPPASPPPMLFGESYGAYLALLVAAQSAPHTWSGCAALAAFGSGARIAGLGTRVSDMVFRLGGQTSPDLEGLVDRIDPPVLLIHGDHDPIVPVTEAVRLAAALKVAGKEVELIRDGGGGHDLLAGPSGAAHRARLAQFFQRGKEGRRDSDVD